MLALVGWLYQLNRQWFSWIVATLYSRVLWNGAGVLIFGRLGLVAVAIGVVAVLVDVSEGKACARALGAPVVYTSACHLYGLVTRCALSVLGAPFVDAGS